MENTPLPISNSTLQQSTPTQSQAPLSQAGKNKGLLLAVVGLLALVATGAGGYYLGSRHVEKNINSSNNVSIKPLSTPTPTSVNSSISGWQTFSSASFPGEFQFPQEFYTATTTDQDGFIHIFINHNPIVVPQTWDSPFTSVDIRVVSITTADDNYEKWVEQVKSSYLAETLMLEEITAGNQEGIIISGTFGEGYAGGERVVQGLFKAQDGYVHANYYPFVDKSFTEEQFKEILRTFDLK